MTTKSITNLSWADFWVEVFNQMHSDELDLSQMLMVKGDSLVWGDSNQSIETHLMFKVLTCS